jgi:hypothetical protein
MLHCRDKINLTNNSDCLVVMKDEAVQIFMIPHNFQVPRDDHTPLTYRERRPQKVKSDRPL